MPAKKRSTTRGAKTQASDLAALEALAEEGEYLDRQLREDRVLKVLQPGRLSSRPEQNLGQRLQEIRDLRKMTQGELSQLTKGLDEDDKGISRAVISLYEAGTNRPSPKEIRLLCEALQITPNFLIYGVEEPFDDIRNYERLGTIGRRSDPEVFAWVAYVMSHIHHNHYDAVMKLVLDLARAWDKTFDQGVQAKANAQLLEMADQLRVLIADREKLSPIAPRKKKS